MKKVLFLLPLLLLLTGCGGQKVSCTITEEQDGKKYQEVITANLKDGKIVSGKAEMIFETKEEAEETCQMMQGLMALASDDQKVDIKCEGKKMIINSLDFDSSEGEDKIIGKTKEDFINAIKEEYPEAVCK